MSQDENHSVVLPDFLRSFLRQRHRLFAVRSWAWWVYPRMRSNPHYALKIDAIEHQNTCVD